MVAGGRSGTIKDFSVDRLRTSRHCFFAKADAEHVKAKIIHWVSSEDRETNQYQTSTGTTISLADIRHVLDVLCEEEGKSLDQVKRGSRSEGQKLGKRSGFDH